MPIRVFFSSAQLLLVGKRTGPHPKFNTAVTRIFPPTVHACCHVAHAARKVYDTVGSWQPRALGVGSEC